MTNNAFSHEPTTQKIEDTRHKQINLLRPSAYIIFADMKETSALIDKACRNLNIDSLNGMQKQMFETAMRPNDIILLSPTGSGKTLAFLLPVLSRIYPKNCRSASTRHRSFPRARFTNRQRIAQNRRRYKNSLLLRRPLRTGRK